MEFHLGLKFKDLQSRYSRDSCLGVLINLGLEILFYLGCFPAKEVTNVPHICFSQQFPNSLEHTLIVIFLNNIVS